MNIVCDIETKDLKVNTQINFVGFYWEEDPEDPSFMSFKLPDDLEMLKRFIKNQESWGTSWVFHNGKFDTVRILYSYGIDMKISHDTMILAYLCSTVDELKENRGKWLGLKYAAPRILGVENWDVGLSKKTSTSEADVLEYLEKDCKYTYKLFEALKVALSPSRYKTYRLIMEAINSYKYVEINGLPIDTQMLQKVRNEYTTEHVNITAQLKEIADINYNSPKQLQKLLFEDLALPIGKMTKSGQPSTGVMELIELQGKHPIVDLILKQREVEKALTFLDSWDTEKILHDDGSYRVHSNFNMHGTVTGRTSSSDVNLQQVPRNKKLKSLFRSTIPGWQLVCMDYSQLELRFAGLVANVAAIKDSYRNGVDLHTLMAAKVAGCSMEEVTKEMRTQAKAINFGFIYGMQAPSFVEYAKASYGVTVSLEESMHIRESFFELYPELNDYYEEVEANMMATCMLTSIMGREYEVNFDKLLNPYERSNWIRPAINFPVQSAGSDYVICGLIEIVNTPKLKDKVKVCATVHDSVIALVKEDEAFPETICTMQHIMEHPQLAQQCLTTEIDIPIVVDVEIGPLGKGVNLEEYIKMKEGADNE